MLIVHGEVINMKQTILERRGLVPAAPKEPTPAPEPVAEVKVEASKPEKKTRAPRAKKEKAK